MLIALFASASPAADVANPYEEADESELFAFDEQLVTVASRYAETTREAPSIVAVITAADLRERGCRTLSDALRFLPGIDIWKSPEGRDLALFRGIVAPDNNKVLLLVDGVPWYDGVYTHAFVDDYLPIANVRQIEVIKGPGSAIYGTNAFAGVINVVTWSAEDLDGARVRWTGGSGGRNDLTGMAGGTFRIGSRDASAVATVRAMSQDGQGIGLEPDGDPNALGEDPKRGLMIGARLSVAGFEAQLDHVDYRHTYLIRQNAYSALGVVGTDLDTAGIRYHDTFVDLRWHAKLGRYGSLTPHLWSQRHDDPGDYWYGGFITNEDTDGDGVPDPAFGQVLVQTEKDTSRAGAAIDADVRPFVDHHTVAGAGIETTTVWRLEDVQYDADHRDGEFTGFGIEIPEHGPKKNLCNGYAYVQHTWVALPGVEIIGGTRLDHRFGCGGYDPGATAFNLTPRGGLLLVPSDKITAKLLFGTAFRDPTVREVMVAAPVGADNSYEFTSANPDLLPERIQTAEGELAVAATPGVDVRGDVFWSQVLNEINIVDRDRPGPEADGPRYENIDSTLQVFGVEAEATGEVGPLRAHGSFTLSDATYHGDEFDGATQYEFPPWMAKADARLAAGERLSATLAGQVLGPRPRADWGLPDGKIVGLVDLGVRATHLGPGGRGEVGLSVWNVLDHGYSTGPYRDDAADPDVGGGIAGEGRRVDVSVEVAL